MKDIINLQFKFSVLVIGDLILDNYWFGNVNRISPEAPVPILNFERANTKPGGASNVAHNIAHLGADCTLVGVVGKDSNGEILCSDLVSKKVTCKVIKSKKFRTISKLRIMNEAYQIVRVDFEEEKQNVDQKKLFKLIKDSVDKHSVIVLSDYRKGVLTDELTIKCIKEAKARQKVILADPKGSDFQKYKGVTLMKPNLHEFEKVVGKCLTDQDLVMKGEELRNKLNLKYLLITLGARGMVLLEKGSVKWFSSLARSVYDVSGAGDTVISSIAAMLAAGMGIAQAIDLANVAAGIAVGKIGTATVSLQEISSHSLLQVQNKIYSTVGELSGILDFHRASGKKIVMTNGCFDILHRGHVSYLEEAQSLGDILVVALNSDSSVNKLKGQNRPINKLEDRAIVLASLASVDFIISFEEETPLSLYEEILPDILVKGGDYQSDNMVGASEIVKAGGKVKILEFLDGFSTTALIEHISKPEI
jgi:D-beta-D-heptose 7-phosphate kinase/D-beta-D-heptose 1-phosphate adenosyltransferase